MTTTRPLRIFIAGPYTGESLEETEKNVRDAIDVALVIKERGHFPFIPHLFHYIDAYIAESHWHRPINYEGWMEWCGVYLDSCNALFFLGPSPGTNREIVRAASAGKTIYTSVTDIPWVVNEHDEEF